MRTLPARFNFAKGPCENMPPIRRCSEIEVAHIVTLFDEILNRKKKQKKKDISQNVSEEANSEYQKCYWSIRELDLIKDTKVKASTLETITAYLWVLSSNKHQRRYLLEYKNSAFDLLLDIGTWHQFKLTRGIP
ncbi:hypothetical protein Trydic_g16381 [Trypoxylus dichotomus]